LECLARFRTDYIFFGEEKIVRGILGSSFFCEAFGLALIYARQIVLHCAGISKPFMAALPPNATSNDMVVEAAHPPFDLYSTAKFLVDVELQD
jgi:hypothetical protein